MGVGSPAEIAEIWIRNGVNKAGLPAAKILLLGMLAGVYIGFGADAFILATAVDGSAFQMMLARLVGAALFPAGLMMVVLCGAELFTGNNLLTLALLDGKITGRQMIRNWAIAYIGNFAGSVILALLLAESGLLTGLAGERAVSLAVAKTSMPFTSAVIRGVLCNVLVVLACWFQAGAKDMPGKILGIWFPITVFVFAGFEHSVADMTYVTLGIFLGADVTWGTFFFGNLVPVTIGNLIGGAVVIPFIYYYAYRPCGSDASPAEASGGTGSVKTVGDKDQKTHEETVVSFLPSDYKGVRIAADGRTRDEITEALLDKIVGGKEFHLSDDEIDEDVEYQLLGNIHRLNYESFGDPDNMPADIDIDIMREEIRKEVIRDLKVDRLIDDIVKNEEIIATPEDLEEEGRRLAVSQDMSLDMVRCFFGCDLSGLEGDVIRRKAREFIYDEAEIL